MAAARAFAGAALSGVAASGAPAAACAEPSPQRFALIADGAPTKIYADTEDYPGVRRAASNLKADLASIAGAAGSLSIGGAIPGGSIVTIGMRGDVPMTEETATGLLQRIVAFRGDLPASYFDPPESARKSAAACEGLAKP